MPKVLLLMPTLFSGGSEKQVRLIAQELSKRTINVTIVVESRLEDNYLDEEKFINENPSIHILMANTSGSNNKSSGKIIKYVTKMMSLVKLVHIVKNVIVNEEIDNMMVTNLTGLVMLPQVRNKLKCFIYNERNPGEKTCNAFWKRYLLKHCDLLLANSVYATQFMSERLKHKVQLINNGIILKDYINQPTRDAKKRIFVPARISVIKNQKVIIEAARILKNELNLEIHFAGTIEDRNYYFELKKLVAEYELGDVVQFLGFVSAVDKYYKEDDLLILPSYEEGTPNVLLEAFSCRMKVLASNIPMNSYCIQDNDYLFEPDNACSLAKKIRMVLFSDCEEVKRITDNNYNFVKKNYSLEKMGEKYAEIFMR